MNNEQGWQAPEDRPDQPRSGQQGPQTPGGSPPPSYGPPPGYGPPPTGWSAPPGYAPPPPGYGPPPPGYGYGPPAGYGPSDGPGGPGGWTPPPKPGLIPLRPLGFGTLMGAPFQVLRRNPKPTFGSALLIQAVVVLASLVVVGGVSVFAVSRIGMAKSGDVDAVAAGAVTSVLLSALVPIVLSLIGSALLQGVIVGEVARGTVGEKLRMRALWRGITGRRWALIAWVLLVTAALIVAIAILGGLVTVLVLLGPGGIAAGVILGIFGGLALIALGIWIGIKVSLVPSVIVLERASIRTAIARSWSLTHGYYWRTFGVLALIAIILGFASQIVTIPISLIYSFAVVLIDPTGASGANGSAIVVAIGSYLVMILVSIVVSSITSIVQSAAACLVYIDLRMRKEGLDLALVRFVENRQAGTASTQNPFAVQDAAPRPFA